MGKIYLNALPAKNRKILEILEGIPLWSDFYLAGGSGLALQMAHRISIDFDFFSKKISLSNQERKELIKSLKRYGKVMIVTNKEGTLRVLFNSVGLAFFYYPYPLVKPPIKYERLRIASIMDIGLMKLAAIVGRGSKKDFFDIYFILKDYTPLAGLLELSNKKFSDVRDFTVQALRALTYFTDAEPEPTPRMLKRIDWSEVKRFLTNEVRIVSRKRFGIE